MLKKVEAKCKRCKKEFCKRRTEQDFCSAQCRNAAWKKPRKRRLEIADHLQQLLDEAKRTPN